MERNKIYVGDNLDLLKTFPDESVDCCITSPPYYGLRDYGTGTWVGGDPNCNHITDGFYNNRNFINEDGRGGNNPSIGGHICKLCGAIKEDRQIGLEDTPTAYIDRLVTVFREVHRVLKPEGTLWVNIGDTYNGMKMGNTEWVKRKELSDTNNFVKSKWDGAKQKDLLGIPWELAFALRKDGWYLRQDIIWFKINPMPEPAKDRCVKSHEYIFLLSKSPKYYFDYEAIQEVATGTNKPRVFGKHNQIGTFRNDIDKVFDGGNGMRNKRDVWSISPSHYSEAHFATFPEELVLPMLLAGCPSGGVVLDPFMGSGTTAVVAKRNCRDFIGCELNPEYVEMAERRIKGVTNRLFKL